MLYNCKNKEIISIHNHFEKRYLRCVKNFKIKPVSTKIKEILNVMPTCHDLNKDSANSNIYVTLKKTNV